MSLKINSDQQRIQASGVTPTGNWVNATYSRTVSGTVNILSVAHGFIGSEKLYIDFTSGGEVDGTYTVTKVDDDNLQFSSSNLGVITAGNTLSYKRVRSLSIQGDETIEMSVGVDANEKDALTLNLNPQNNIRVGVNTTDPQYELDVEGQIRTTRSIISDTAQVVNLDIQTIINPALALRAPNLINYEDTDVTSDTYGTTFYPTADTPPLTDQSRRVATTDFVYKVATNDTGGRVYVSQTIGSDLNDGRSAARPVKTIKKAAQIAYTLQKATPDPSDEYVSLIVSGGEYLEDNPISLPRNCSLIGDNLRRVIVRPQNADRHMIKASNETYVFGCVFRDALQNSSDPQSTVIHTWKYAFVFDDKQRMYYEPELGQVPAIPGDKFRGDNIFQITFTNHTGNNTTLVAGYFVQGGSSGTLGTVQSVNFTGPVASPYSTGTCTILITSGVNDVFQDAEKLFYDAVAANIVTDINNNPSDRFDVADAESLRPELETISNQIYQHTINSERETTAFAGDSTKVNLTTDTITITGHSFKTGDQVYYQKDENTTALGGLIDNSLYYVRFIDANSIQLFDTWTNATTTTSTTGRKDLTAVSTDTKLHLFTSGKVMPEGNHIFIDTHQFATGDGVVYRESKMGGITGLVDGTTYYIYKENTNWVRLAASAANAVQKDAQGNDNPVTLTFTGTGQGYQRFELASRVLSIATIDTSLATQQTYNGPVFNLSGTSYHDYEVGQEVNLYGFQSAAINFGASTNTSWSLASGEVTVTISTVDNSLTTALFSNWSSLGACGLKFNFSGAGSEALSKVYEIDSFTTGSTAPSLPGNTELGLGRGNYNSSNLTVTFVLKVADIQSTTNTATASGSTVSVLDNVEDLNGRRYITNRIERADGYSLQFVVRAAVSVFDATLNPTGNQSVISTSNYVLASLRNSPYGFTKISQTARFRDGAESIRANQEFIAQEAYGYVKSHYEKSSTRASNLVIGPTTFNALGDTFTHPITEWSTAYNKLTVKCNTGHNLFRGFQNHNHTYNGGTATNAITITQGSVQKNVTGATYDPVTGDLVLTIGAHSYTTANTLTIGNGALSFTCSRDNHATSHTYPRATDPAYGATLAITAVDAASSVTVNVGVSAGVKIAGSGTAAINGTWAISDIVDHRTFILDLGLTTLATATTGTDGTFVDIRKPYRTPNTFPANNKQADAADLIAANAEMIAEVAVEKMVADTGYSVPTGNTACTDDIKDFLKKSLYHNLKWGGNDRVYDAANYFLKDVTTSNQSKYVTAFNLAKGYAQKVLRNLPILRHPYTTHPQQYETITLDRATYGTVPNLTQDAANLINVNNKFISEEAVERFISSLTETPIDAVSGNDITINALNGTTPTNTTAHTFQGLSTYQFQPTNVTYDPISGEMVITIASHPFVDGDKILIAPNSLSFTCDLDGDTATKTYPRTTDPYYNKYIGVRKVDANNIKVNVGKAKTDVTAHAFVSATSTAITRAVVYNDIGYTQHTVTGASYEPITGVLTLKIPGHGFTIGEKVQVAQDSLTFTCTMDDNFSKHTYPRATDPALNVWKSVSNITTDTFDINVGTTPPVTYTPTNAVYTPTTGLMEVTIGNHSITAPTSHTPTGATLENSTGIMTVTINDHGFQEGDKINLAVGAITMSCAYGGSGSESYPKAGQYLDGKWVNIWGVTQNTFKFDCTGGAALTVNDAHTFVSAVSNSLKHVAENIKLTNGAITFKCDEDSQSTEHSYPRTTVDSHTAGAGTTYDPATGIMKITTTAAHGMRNGDWIKMAENSITFSCAFGGASGPASQKSYPRATDPIAGKWQKIFNVTSTTFEVQVLSTIPSTNTDTHTFVSATSGGITQKRDKSYNTSVPVVATTGTTVTLDVGISTNTTTHAYQSALGNSVITGGNYAHTWISATSNGVKRATSSTINNYNPSASTYDPNTGAMVLTIGSNNFLAPTTHTASGGAYDPLTGIMTVTITNHGFKVGDKVKFAVGAISFSCTHGSGGTTAYPRSTDPIANKWVTIANVTANTFDVQVLDTVPSTNTTPHTYQSAAADAISYARSTVKIATNSIIYSCGHGAGNHTYPRATDPIANPRFTIPNHNQDCKDDASDVLRAVAYNLVNGGNDAVYDHAGYFVGTTHVDGEQFQARAVFEIASDITQQVIANETVNIRGWHGVEQTKDLTITVDPNGCATPKSTVDTLFSIVEQAIATDSLAHATDTAASTPTCTDVVSATDTLFAIVTTALGTDGSYGNLNSVVRTVSEGDQQCIDDILHVVRAFQYDLRYTGNSKTVEAANKYITSGAISHVTEEVDYTRAIFAYAKELCIKAIRNNLEAGFFSQIAPVSNGSITVDSSAPECANVVSALTTNWGILDNVLSSATAYSGTITNPDPLISEQDAAKYTFPLLNLFLDLPVIEASPFIQNASLISFLGGSGCDIDGAKCATPNVPRPGLKLNSQGNTIAQFDPQGKSMVANAFTIISFGGTGYNITNDGYTQVVSVFAIFCQDGIVCQSGGYASVTNSASNFGTYSLRASGFRADPYAFDIGVIDSITNDVDGNQVETGRQVIQVSGTALTNIPTEDYIIRIGGTSPTDPAVEHIILETEVISGSPGTQIVAKITTNRSMDYTDTASPNTRYRYADGNLGGLVSRAIQFHRPSIVNSSSHTWEYSGSGNTYAALPQNGGFGLGTAYEASEQSFGQVYTSGTNEFGDFKVGNFVTIYNRTGNISFVGTVSISELSSIKIVGGDITITGFSDDDNLGGTFASDALLPTQASVKDYISNNLGPYLNQPYSTNAVPSALVQLTSSGKINIDQIPALRPFNITSVASEAERLAIEDASAGDIAIETTATSFSVAPASVNTGTEAITITGHGRNTGDGLTYTEGTTAIGGLSTATKYFVIKVDDNNVKLASTTSNASNGTAIDLTGQGTGTHTFTTDGTAISYILENDLESQFLAFIPNQNYAFTNGNIITGSSTTARGTIQSYNDGQIYNFVISDGGTGYTGDFALTISAPDSGSGTQAAATANVTSGVVTKVTITNAGSGYYSQPTVTVTPPGSGTTAVIAAQIEGRVAINIANNIKFDAGDFILDGAGANEGTGTYTQSATTITINENGHNLSNASLVYLDFTSGASNDGFYTISLVNANQYTVTSATSVTTSGNVSRKRIIDLARVINTSASNAANWTQLTSTNIDASNIVAGVVDPERLAGKGTSNSYTFLRGDSSWEYALQAIRPTTQDCVVVGGSLTDSTYIDSITITNGGTGYTDGTYQNIPLEGGNVSVTDTGVARATYIVTSGVITSATITDSGTGYTAGFSITIPAEFGGGNGAILAAVKGTINRSYGNIEIDIRKGDNLTPAATVYGNYGVFRFRKDVANQAVGNQDQGGFVIDNNGQVTIDQGAGSELNADKLDGNHGAFYQNAGNLTAGTIDPARLANTTYNISISGTADTANRIFNETASLTSNPSPAQAANGVSAALRNNSATGLTDGGTTHGITTYRREATGSAAIQLGWTDNDNLWIRGNSGGNAVYGNWNQIWSGANDGAASGLDADKLDAHQGLWYQSGYNFGASQGGINKPMGDMFLPEVLGQDKMVFENFYVNDSGLKYTLYIPDYHARTGTNGNINPSGTYTIYSDVGATNNIGSIVVDANGVTEATHTSGEVYTLVTGTIAFVGNNTNANIYVVGPNPGTKWTVTSSNPISSGSTTVIGLRDAAAGAKLQIGKAATSTTPTLDFRSSGQAPNYDVQMIVSGGNTNDGNGTLRINTGDITVNGNTVWHAGNDGSSSQLDAHYLDGFVQSTAASGNTIARRDASGHLTVNDLTGDQGIFNNTGTSVLQLAGGNGVDLGKAATNSLSVKGRNSGSVGYIRFGTDGNDFGWDGTSLSYNNVHFRGGRLGIGTNDPQANFSAGTDTTLLAVTDGGGSSGYKEIAHFAAGNDSNDSGAILRVGHHGNDRGLYIKSGRESGDRAIARFGLRNSSATDNDIVTLRQDGGTYYVGINDTTPSYLLDVAGDIRTTNVLRSTVATGTSPIVVSSTTECTNLNAAQLQGYTANNLPYLRALINTWNDSSEGQPRFYFSNNSHTYFRTGSDFFFRNDADTSIGSLNDNGCWTFYSGSDTTQSTYGLQVNGLNGVNLNASEGLSSGQKSTVLRASGDKLWIDTYGIFRRNRDTVAEDIQVNNGDNTMSAGPITINNGNTITINNGGTWSIV